MVNSVRPEFRQKKTDGASGGFLPRPPAGGKRAEAKRKIKIPRKIDFRFAESVLKPHALPEYLEGRTPKKNVLSFLEEIGRAQIRKSKEHFSLVSAEALRGGGGTVHSFSFRSKKVRANVKITPPNETLSELRKRSDFAGAKIALSIFSKLFPPTAEAVNSQSSPQLKS